jgi:hypothetical protein
MEPLIPGSLIKALTEGRFRSWPRNYFSRVASRKADLRLQVAGWWHNSVYIGRRLTCLYFRKSNRTSIRFSASQRKTNYARFYSKEPEMIGFYRAIPR